MKENPKNVVGVDIGFNIAFFVLVRRSLLRLPSIQVVAHSGIIGTLFRYSSSPTHNSSVGGFPVSVFYLIILFSDILDVHSLSHPSSKYTYI